MTLYEQISEHLKEAMKAGDGFTRDTLRLVQSAVKNAAIDKRVEAKDMTDEDVLDILKRLVKQRRDSIAQYTTGRRADLVEAEQKELDVISVYLPAEMGDDDLMQTVKAALAEAGMTGKQDMGKAMGVAMKAVVGRANGDRVKEVVGTLLN
jgi:uncharacterized protein